MNSGIKELMNSRTLGVCISNRHGHMIEANAVFCRMFGFGSKEVPWHYLVDLHRHREDWDRLRNIANAMDPVLGIYSRMKKRSGRGFHCLLDCFPLREKEGEKPRHLIVFRKLAKKPKSNVDGYAQEEAVGILEPAFEVAQLGS